MSGTSSRTSSSTSDFGHPLVDVAGPRLEQQRLPHPQVLAVQQRLGQPDDLLLVGVPHHEGALAVGEDLLEHDDLADALEVQRRDDVHRLVEHDLLAADHVVEVHAGAHGDPQLAAAGEDVDGLVVVARDEDAEAGGRLGQPVDLFLQGHDLVTSLLEGRDQPLVLGGDPGEVRLQVGHAFLEGTQVARRLGEPLAQGVDLVAQRADLRILVAARARRTASAVAFWTVRGRHGVTSPGGTPGHGSRTSVTLPSADRERTCTPHQCYACRGRAVQASATFSP